MSWNIDLNISKCQKWPLFFEFYFEYKRIYVCSNITLWSIIILVQNISTRADRYDLYVITFEHVINIFGNGSKKWSCNTICEKFWRSDFGVLGVIWLVFKRSIIWCKLLCGMKWYKRVMDKNVLFENFKFNLLCIHCMPPLYHIVHNIDILNMYYMNIKHDKCLWEYFV